jgi:outer membrane protein, heavy metal efflux system
MLELASARVIDMEGLMKGLLIAGLTSAVLAATAAAAAGNEVEASGISPRGASELKELIAEAIKANPEIRAADNERLAARQRIAPAGALDDPMLEAGFLNVPTTSYRLNREDMTMKMLGVAQKLPWPGKRALREQVAEREAQTADYGVRETTNRIAREVKLAYYDLARVNESLRLMQESRGVLEQMLSIAEGRYTVGQGTQADVLRVQTQLGKMSDDILRMERERPAMEAELSKLISQTGVPRRFNAELPLLDDRAYDYQVLREQALERRPQLLGLKTAVDRGNAALELARKEYKPDFEVRAAYGQRENMLDGTRRSDMLSLTVAINIPMWGKEKIDPHIAEAQAMRDQALAMYEAQQHELSAKLQQQLAILEQSRKSAKLYENTIVPQSELAFDSTLSAYRVSRADLPMLLDTQMNVFAYRTAKANAMVDFNKALAEINLLTGAPEVKD